MLHNVSKIRVHAEARELEIIGSEDDGMGRLIQSDRSDFVSFFDSYAEKLGDELWERRHDADFSSLVEGDIDAFFGRYAHLEPIDD